MLEAGADWKSGDTDFFSWDLLAAQGLEGVEVSDEEVIAGGPGPGCIDLDGVGDDRNNRDAAAFFVEEPVDHVGVEGVGVDDEIGFEVIE